MSLFRGRLKVIAPFKFKLSLKAAVKIILFRGWWSIVESGFRRNRSVLSDVAAMYHWKCYRRYHCFVSFTHDREMLPPMISKRRPLARNVPSSMRLILVLRATAHLSSAESPPGISLWWRRKSFIWGLWCCAYHIIVCKPRNKKRRSLQQRRQLSSSASSPRTTTTITFIKRWRRKMGTLAFHRRLPLFMHESLSWRLTFTCRMRFHDSLFVLFLRTREWLYGSMIVYKFVIKLSANKEAATKSTWSDCNFKFSLLTLFAGGPRSCSKLLGLFGKGFFYLLNVSLGSSPKLLFKG